MTLARCIPELIEAGALTPEQGRRAQEVYGKRRRQFEGRMSAEAADAAASEAAVKELEQAAMLRERQTVLQIKAQKRMIADMARYNGGKGPSTGSGQAGPIDPRAAVALLDRDARAPYSNVEGRRKAILGQAHAMMDRLLREHSRNIIGEVRDKAQLRDVVAELFGRNSGNAHARELAESWTAASEMLRQRFNAAGGAIGKLEKWGLPQGHDALKVRKAGEAEWLSFIKPLLDRGRMVDRDTGLPLSDPELDLLLKDVWETIRTDGWADRAPGGAGRSKLANQGQAHRYLHFAGPDQWTAYAERFGTASAFDAMMGHMERMARDVALIEVLGPNPNASIQWLKDSVTKAAQIDKSPGATLIDKAGKGRFDIERIYRELSGANMEPRSRALALGFSAVRSYETATKLGSATLSAVTDLGFQWSARRFAGIPATRMLGDYLKLLNPASAEDRLLATRLGLIADQWSTMSSGTHRYLMEELTGEVSRRLAEGVLRASGLSAWTQAGRWAFGMQFLGHLTREAGKSFDGLDEAFAATLQRYGIGAAEWDAIRATPPEMERGVPWLKPQRVADPALGDRLLEMVLSEVDFAVPVADLNTKAWMSTVTPRGTLLGEIVRSQLLFKSFGVSVLMNQGSRLLQQTSWSQRANVAIGFLIPVVLMGAAATQLKDIGKGRDPRPMNDKRFWLAAMAQSGGFGLAGDFLASTTDQYGGSVADLIGGPVARDVQSFADIFKGDKDRMGWKATNFAKQMIPGNSLWYLRLGLDRMLADRLQEEIDPDYRDSWRRLDRYAEDWGQQYWWAPGDAPDAARAPDFANAWEGTIPEEEEE